MSNIRWLGKGLDVDFECVHCFTAQSIDIDLDAIKERLKHYYFATRMQENDFINLMIMVEKLRGKK
jgi:hypothetical protein